MHRKSGFKLKWVFLSAFLLTFSGLLAQINIKIGYGGAYTIAENTNNIISTYNGNMAGMLNENVKSMHWLHGINMGARFKWKYFAAELSWESLGNQTKAVEINNNNATQKNVYFRLNHLSFSAELLTGFMGMGASIDQGNYKIETELNGTDQNKVQAASWPLTSKFYLAFYIRGSEYMSFAIKPYYRAQWNNGLDMSGLSQYLNVDNQIYLEKFDHLGIEISFYNGLQ